MKRLAIPGIWNLESEYFPSLQISSNPLKVPYAAIRNVWCDIGLESLPDFCTSNSNNSRPRVKRPVIRGIWSESSFGSLSHLFTSNPHLNLNLSALLGYESQNPAFNYCPVLMVLSLHIKLPSPSSPINHHTISLVSSGNWQLATAISAICPKRAKKKGGKQNQSFSLKCILVNHIHQPHTRHTIHHLAIY